MAGQRRPEVLAPAGSFESMKAAVAAGADGVYIGGSRFGARAYADNPDQEQLLEAIDYAHLHGVSLYMTVNTLMKEQELEELYDFLAPYYERGLDGVIVQDLGAVSCIRQWFPDLPVHGSTQMTVTGVYGARILERLGVKRVVTAREMSLEEIERIHREVPIEIESFVHGALCYCYSGQCLLSSFIGGRSGNRGRCAQPCRLPYMVSSGEGEAGGQMGKARAGKTEGKNSARGRAEGKRKAGVSEREYSREGRSDSYILSMKDLCTLDIIPDMIEAGICSLKIEGRMKSPRYTAGVVHVYRNYVDMYLKNGREGYKVDPADRQMLLDLFDRGGFTEGYYRQHNGPDMIARREKPRFRQANQELFDRLDRLYVEAEKKEPVRGRLTVREGEPLALRLELDSGTGEVSEVNVRGARAQKAENRPASVESLERQIKKTGNTPFVFESLETDLEGQVFVPVQALNELRRDGLEALRESVLQPYRRPAAERTGQSEEAGQSEKVRQSEKVWQGEEVRQGGETQPERETWTDSRTQKKGTRLRPALHVLLPDTSGLSGVLAVADVREIIIESDGTEAKDWPEIARQCHERGKSCVLAMPVIFRKHAQDYFEKRISALKEAGFDGILVRALEEIEYLRGRGINMPLFADHNLYVFNHRAGEVLAGLGCGRVTLPLELNGRELASLTGGEKELVVYGFLPAMVSAQCVKKTTSGCTRSPQWLMLKDRTGKELPVRNHCAFCYNIIYNPDPLSLMSQLGRIQELAPASVRLCFTRESVSDIGRITREWAEALSGQGKPETGGGNFTRGHFKRGVE